MPIKQLGIEWNKVHYCDCMDPDIGLPSLPDKSVGLGYTDPPWGINIHKTWAQGTIKNGKKLVAQENLYDDTFNPEFNLKWFNELNRICKNIILLPGEKHKFWWIRNTDPYDEIIIHLQNGLGRARIARYNRKSTYLFYGKTENKLLHNVFDYVVLWGFLSHDGLVHPSRKGPDNALIILNQLKPKSLIDPFAGSGSFLKAADILGIPWLGYEINKVYKQDIDKRFAQKQIDLWNY